MIGTSFPTTTSRRPIPEVRASGSTETPQSSLSIPKDDADCGRLLSYAAARIRMPEHRAWVARELARFIGASSTAWSLPRRRVLRELLAGAGDDGLQAVLETIARAPYAQVIDEARLILGVIARQSSQARELFRHVASRTVAAPVRVASVRALADAGDTHARRLAVSLFDDRDAETRDAAVWVLASLGASAADALRLQAAREISPLVNESIATALSDLDVG